MAGQIHLKRANIATTVFLARALRAFGDGFIVLLVPFFLAARGLDAFAIGVVAALGVFGSALTTIAIGFVSQRFGERALLIAASILMAATGFAFATSEVTALFFLIAFVGTINPSSGSSLFLFRWSIQETLLELQSQQKPKVCGPRADSARDKVRCGA